MKVKKYRVIRDVLLFLAWLFITYCMMIIIKFIKPMMNGEAIYGALFIQFMIYFIYLVLIRTYIKDNWLEDKKRSVKNRINKG